MSVVGCEEAYQCLLVPYAEFLRTSKLDDEQGRRVWRLISKQAYPWEEKHRTAAELRAEERWITTGDAHIDKLLGGGIRLGSIVEVVGESATGKTQLCLQLAIAAQLPEAVGGANGDVVYISTEGAFPAKRLTTMIDPFVRRVYGDQEPDHGLTDVDEFMHHIQVAELDDMETMFHALDYKVPAILSTGRVRLVIIDSIAAHLRFDMESGEGGFQSSRNFYKERSSHLMQMGSRFKRWADEYKCAFVCVNQVKDIIDDSGPSHGAMGQRPHNLPLHGSSVASGSELSTEQSLMDSDGEFATMAQSKKAPALGPLWASIINARIMLYQRRGLAQGDTLRTEQMPDSSVQQGPAPPPYLLRTRRWLENAFSPWAQRAQCEVILDDGGFRHALTE
ncbi:DNA repair protein rhp57 [Coemansia guatemalensis]|uniref:DNA repair protein rhp57 n=1 Tax=Coemansia guatemalensis TaxID=2761395 RepID=A0A9W8HY88_9FUNG|nr:DNA repair protein rhp57 [Coemansia guatemalensis]